MSNKLLKKSKSKKLNSKNNLIPVSYSNFNNNYQHFSSNTKFKKSFKTYVELFKSVRNIEKSEETYGPIKDWDVSEIKNMSGLFKGINFDEDISNWNTSNVTDMSNMFNNAEAFNQDISNWKTLNVTNMNSMFSGASSFNKPIGNWNTSKVINMSSMFSGASAFNQPIGDWNVSNVNSMYRMFYNATSFNQNLNNWFQINTQYIYMPEMFACDDDIESNPSFNNGNTYLDWNLYIYNYIGGMFHNASSFDQDISNIFRNTFTLLNQFYNWNSNDGFDKTNSSLFLGSGISCENMLKFVTKYDPDRQIVFRLTEDQKKKCALFLIPGPTPTVFPNEKRFKYKSFKTYAELYWAVRNIKLYEKTYGPIEDWDVSQIENMQNLFHNLNTFDEDISNWNTSNVTNMRRMFKGASSFNQDISNWNVNKVTNMIAMFQGATDFNQDITTKQVTNSNKYTYKAWDTSNVTEMWSMFSGASAFNQDIGNWNTSEVTNMSSMFSGASAFNQPIGDWNTSNVTNMSSMFYNATSFNQNLNNWFQIRKYKYAQKMFMCDNDIQSKSSFNNGNTDLNWNLSSSSYIGGMFHNASSFDQDISNIFGNTFTLGNQFYNWNGKTFNKTNSTLFLGSGMSCVNMLKFVKKYDPDKQIVFRLTPKQKQKCAIFLRPGPTPTVFPNEKRFKYKSFQDPEGLEKLSKSDIDFNNNIIHRNFEILIQSDLYKAVRGEIDFMDKYGPIENWDVSQITNMSCLFYKSKVTNWKRRMEGLGLYQTPDVTLNYTGISNWNVSNVIDMSFMFVLSEIDEQNGTILQSSSFNEDISNWTVTNVINMRYMFYYANSFNQPIGGWNVSNVKDMSNMFYNATSFDQDISSWVNKINNLDVVKDWDWDENTGFKINDKNSSIFFDSGMSCVNMLKFIKAIDPEKTINFRLTEYQKKKCEHFLRPAPTPTVFPNEKRFKYKSFQDPKGLRTLSKSDIEEYTDKTLDNLFKLLDSDLYKAVRGQIDYMDEYGPIEDWDVSQITNMSGLFFKQATLIKYRHTQQNDPPSITEQPNFDVTLNYSGISNWNVTNVTDMSFMFITSPNIFDKDGNGNENEDDILPGFFNEDISNWDVSNVINMRNMFYKEHAFNQPIGSWDTINVIDMSNMFDGASAFNQPIGSWDTSNVINMSEMFRRATSFNQNITTKQVTNSNEYTYKAWDTSNVTNISNMFNGATSFNNGDDANQSNNTLTWDTSNVTDMQNMFYDASAFNQDISDWARGKELKVVYNDPENEDEIQLTNRIDTQFSQIFEGSGMSCVNMLKFIKIIDPKKTITFTLTDEQKEKCADFLRPGPTPTVFPNEKRFKYKSFKDPEGLPELMKKINDEHNFLDSSNNFLKLKKLLDESDLYKAVKNPQFYKDIYGPIELWDVSQITYMSGLFKENKTFNEDISKWNVSNVTNMNYMFSGASDFNQDIGNWDTSNVESMFAMFYNAEAFNQDIGDWNTSNVTHMGFMFFNAKAFNNPINKKNKDTYIAWNTSNVTNMNYMFAYAKNFNQDISKWFQGKNLIYIGNFSNIFYNSGMSCVNMLKSIKAIDPKKTIFFNLTLEQKKKCADFLRSVPASTPTVRPNVFAGYFKYKSFKDPKELLSNDLIESFQPYNTDPNYVEYWFNNPIDYDLWQPLFDYISKNWNKTYPINIKINSILYTSNIETYNERTISNFKSKSSTPPPPNAIFVSQSILQYYNQYILNNSELHKAVRIMLNKYNTNSFSYKILIWYNRETTDFYLNLDKDLIKKLKKHYVDDTVTDFSWYNELVNNWNIQVKGQNGQSDSETYSFNYDNDDRSWWETSGKQQHWMKLNINNELITNLNILDDGTNSGDSLIFHRKNPYNQDERQNILNIYGPINKWDVSQITNMSYLFYYYKYDSEKANNFDSWLYEQSTERLNISVFNDDISKWNTANVTEMKHMFNGASAFNQDISSWNVSNVTDMSNMFYNAKAFNQPIGNWNTSNVTNMHSMFDGAITFNHPINTKQINKNENTYTAWNVSNVTNMNYMFSGASDFNQDIGNWDTSNVESMFAMFYYAMAFNQDIGDWNTSNVTHMGFMFFNAKAFNNPINKKNKDTYIAWNTSNVTNMNYMFAYAKNFNQDIGNWDTSNVENMFAMFYNAEAFNQNISSWDVSKVTNMHWIFNINESDKSDMSCENLRMFIKEVNNKYHNLGDICKNYPTSMPTISPSMSPTISPTSMPTVSPSMSPTISPTSMPTVSPSMSPTISPTSMPTVSPSVSPTVSPTSMPTIPVPMGLSGTIAPPALITPTSPPQPTTLPPLPQPTTLPSQPHTTKPLPIPQTIDYYKNYVNFLRSMFKDKDLDYDIHGNNYTISQLKHTATKSSKTLIVNHKPKNLNIGSKILIISSNENETITEENIIENIIPNNSNSDFISNFSQEKIYHLQQFIITLKYPLKNNHKSYVIKKLDDPEKPVGPVGPVELVEPVEPVGPVGPVGPVEPVGPIIPYEKKTKLKLIHVLLICLILIIALKYYKNYKK